MGMDCANPIVAVLNGVIILYYQADELAVPRYADTTNLLDHTITNAFSNNSVRQMEFTAICAQNLLQTPFLRPVRSCCQNYNANR